MKRLQFSKHDVTDYLKKIRPFNRYNYNDYFQIEHDPDKREDRGLHKLLNSIFPMESKTKELNIKYVNYTISKFPFDAETLVHRHMSYVMSIDVNLIIENKGVTKPYVIPLPYVPIMLSNGSFLINGAYKMIIYQLAKVGGIHFSMKNNILTLNITTSLGMLITFTLTTRNIVMVSINRSKKISLLAFLKLLDEDQINTFLKNYTDDTAALKFFSKQTMSVKVIGLYSKLFDVILTNNLVRVLNAKKYINEFFSQKINNFETEDEDVLIPLNVLNYAFVSEDLQLDNDLMVERGTQTNQNFVKIVSGLGDDFKHRTKFLFLYDKNVLLYKSLNIHGKNEEEDEEEEQSYDYMDEDENREIRAEPKEKVLEYQITSNIRERINTQLGVKYSRESLFLTAEDLILAAVCIVNTQLSRNVNFGIYDTIMHKRIKSPESLIEHILTMHLNKARKAISSRGNFYSDLQGGNKDIINVAPISADIKKVFNVGAYIQYFDMTNPLSGISHARRASSLYSSSTEKYRANVNERSIHLSQYGRMCAVKTPEGLNMGVTTSIACAAIIDADGFLLAPYYRFYTDEHGKKVLDRERLIYLTAEDEMQYRIASFVDIHEDNEREVLCRHRATIMTCMYSEIDLFEALPYQMFSYSAALIPFLDHNDSHRILMGANMYDQAKPLVIPEVPVVGTGFERFIGDIVEKRMIAEEDTKIYYADSKYIVHSANTKSAGLQVISLNKFNKTNMKTCLNEFTNLSAGDVVKKSDHIFESNSIKDAEIAVGQNVLVGLASWFGHTYEDAILMSDELVRDMKFNSSTIELLEVSARDLEEGITEKFYVSSAMSDGSRENYLDSRAIAKTGTYIRPGMIVVGRAVPIIPSEGAEDTVFSVMFEQKIGTVNDISYRATYADCGYVINVFYYSSRAMNKGDIYTRLKNRIERTTYVYKRALIDKIKEYYECDLNATEVEFIDIEKFIKSKDDKDLKQCFETSMIMYQKSVDELRYFIDTDKRMNIELNIVQYASINLAITRGLESGDKLTNRYGGKGVISEIIPAADMPFLPDGTKLQMIVSSLGIISRMNIGQLFELQLGLCSYTISKNIRFAVRTGDTNAAVDIIRRTLSRFVTSEEQEREIIQHVMKDEYILFAVPAMYSLGIEVLNEMLKSISELENNMLGTLEGGKIAVRCGISGEYYNRKIVVGLAYFLKLFHEAHSKMTMREVGPSYSTVTQQPNASRAKGGGQVLGNMERLAVIAYGAAIVFFSMTTEKCDDIEGRIDMYKNILEHKYILKGHVPERVNIFRLNIFGVGLILELFDHNNEIIKTGNYNQINDQVF